MNGIIPNFERKVLTIVEKDLFSPKQSVAEINKPDGNNNSIIRFNTPSKSWIKGRILNANTTLYSASFNCELNKSATLNSTFFIFLSIHSK